RFWNDGNVANCYAPVSSNLVTVAVSNCPTPTTPVLSQLPQQISSGQSIAVSWSASSNLQRGGVYVLETSHDGFATVDATFRTPTNSAVVPTAAVSTNSTLSFRVHAVQPCGTAGAN